MTVDLGTQRVDFLDNQNAPGREILRKACATPSRAASSTTAQALHADTREFGKTLHFRYFDWSGVKPGEMVLWQHVFRAEGIPLFTMTSDEKQPAAEGEEPKPAPQVSIGLQDAYLHRTKLRL